MSTLVATISGWALRASTVWFPSSGVSSVNSLPSGYLYADTNYISSPSGTNKYTAMIAVTIPSSAAISSISQLSITFCPRDRNSTTGTLYGSLRTVSQSDGSSTSDTASTFRENAIGDEASISTINTSATAQTMTFRGSFSQGSTYYLFLYTKSTNDIYALDYGSGKFSAEITYTEKEFTITYDANGGYGAPSSQTKGYNTVLTLRTGVPSKNDTIDGSYTVTLDATGGEVSPAELVSTITTSYEFTHWNTKSNGTGISYSSGASYTNNDNLRLYAIYSSETTTEELTLSTATRNGYTFLGWATSPTASYGITGKYTPTKDITLYAIWGADGFIYIYDGVSFSAYQIYIYNGSSWDMYCPYVYDGATWHMCS